MLNLSQQDECVHKMKRRSEKEERKNVKKKTPNRKPQELLKPLPTLKIHPFLPEVQVAPDLNVLYHDAADLFVEVARRAVLGNGRFTVALSGGPTMPGFFRLLSQEPFRRQIPWKKTFVFWGDERHVPQDSLDSNFKMAWDHLLSRVPLNRNQVYPMTNGAGTAAVAGEKYEKLLKVIWGSKELPSFDLNLMGVGEDGHTASMFPHKGILKEAKRWVVGYIPNTKVGGRVTLTFPVFNASKLTVVLVEGKRKAAIIQKVLEGKSNPALYPVQNLKPKAGRLIFLMDAVAASKTKWDTKGE
jgi:6-phosphogluconolactonase